MVILSKKFGQLKQWTGEKLGSTNRTEKPTEVKHMQNETKARFERIQNVRDMLKMHTKTLDSQKDSALPLLARHLAIQAACIEDTSALAQAINAFSETVHELASHQDQFADSIRIGLLMYLDATLNEARNFEHLRGKVKSRRLDYDANQNKLSKSRKEKPELEENVKITQQKYEEALQMLEDLMLSVDEQEKGTLDPLIAFAEEQEAYYERCLETSRAFTQALREDSQTCASSRKKSDTLTKAERTVAPRDPVLQVVQAKYSFDAENDSELSISPGDTIEVLKKVNEGWWLGSCAGRRGLFPSNYVTLVESSKMRENGHDAARPRSDPATEDQPTMSTAAEDVLTLSKAGNAAVSNQGFSYIPKGTAISFIGRKRQEEAQEGLQEAALKVDTLCADCGCDEYSPNVFKPGCCNNCFHAH